MMIWYQAPTLCNKVTREFWSTEYVSDKLKPLHMD